MSARRRPSRAWPAFLVGAAIGCTASYVGFAAHSCAVLADGTVWCWGFNGRGQLGDGTSRDSAAPVAVLGLPPARALATGLGFTCAATEGGEVYCWGRNDGGQLGSAPSADVLVAAPVPGLTGVADVAAGRDRACAVGEAGGVWCWGELVGLAPSGVTAIAGLPAPAVKVALGDGMACALLVGGEVWCWTGGEAPAAAAAGALDVAISSGFCVLEADGSVPCAGPLPLPAVAITSGRHQACALLSDGSVWCWGLEFGSGEKASSYGPRAFVAGASAVSVGDGFACARVGGGLSCWGDNWGGQLGDGTDRQRDSPVPVRGLPGPAAAIAASPGIHVLVAGCGEVPRPDE